MLSSSTYSMTSASAAVAQVAQPGQGERPAEAGALLGGIDPHHVDLADGLTWRARGVPVRGPSCSSGGCTLVQWKPDQPAVPLGEEEAVRVEPRLPLAQVQIVRASSAPCSGWPANALWLTADPGVLVAADHGRCGPLMPLASRG